MRVRSRLAAPVLALFFGAGCGGCGGENDSLEAAGNRLWGADKAAADIEALAREPIDSRGLDVDLEARKKVLEMPLDAVVARLGFVVYEGEARISIERNGHTIDVFEKTRIEHALDGAWRVVQWDEDDAILREKVFTKGMYFSRNGPGKMRLSGVADVPGGVTRNEAFQPLSKLTALFGPRLGLRRDGTALVHERPAIKYVLGLTPGAGLIEPPNHPGKQMRPLKLVGQIMVDAETGAPLGGKLSGQLEIAPPDGGKGWGEMKVALRFDVKPVPGAPLPMPEHIPPIERHEVDLDPLGFLEGRAATSTVIGGD